MHCLVKRWRFSRAI